MLDAQIKKAAEYFGVRAIEDWTKVRPHEVQSLHGCGPATVNHLRLYLAGNGLTLRDDQTPAFWQRNIGKAKLGAQLADSDSAIVLPFTVLVDVQEKLPYLFEGFLADSDQDYRPMLVPTRMSSLGPSHGDYSVVGMEGEVHVERKSLEDAIGTFLSHGERRERWLRTLEFLASIKTGAVVIESTFKDIVKNITARGSRSQRDLQRTIYRQVLAWQMDYRIPFVFCDDRRFSERVTLQIFRRHYKHAMKQVVGRQTEEELLSGDL